MTWRRVIEAAARARCSTKIVYHAIRTGRLRAARIGAGRNVITCDEWIDAWLSASADAHDRSDSHAAGQ